MMLPITAAVNTIIMHSGLVYAIMILLYSVPCSRLNVSAGIKHLSCKWKVTPGAPSTPPLDCNLPSLAQIERRHRSMNPPPT